MFAKLTAFEVCGLVAYVFYFSLLQYAFIGG